jgi:hypothetical protein
MAILVVLGLPKPLPYLGPLSYCNKGLPAAILVVLGLPKASHHATA